MRIGDDEPPTSFAIAFRRYWPYALPIGIGAGLFGWWAISDYVGGIVVGVGLFFVTVLTGWEIDPFLPPQRRARATVERSQRRG